VWVLKEVKSERRGLGGVTDIGMEAYYVHPNGQCCYVLPDGDRCPKNDEWRLTEGDGPDDYSDACTDHVGPLLGSERVVVTRLRRPGGR